MITLSATLVLPLLSSLFLVTASNGKDEGGCPEGWQENPAKEDYCYFAEINVKNTYGDALKECRKMESELLWIEDNTEHLVINSLSNSFLSEYWIGLTMNTIDGQFYWSDGRVTDFYKFLWGFQDESKLCATISRHSGYWLHVHCHETHSYVCKKPKILPTPTTTIPTTPPLPVGHCLSSESKEFQGHCYMLSHDPKSNWEDAASACNDLGNGYKLASVHSEVEAAFIYTLVADLPLDNVVEYWIGGTKIAGTGKWVWNDNTEYDFSHWGSGEPNSDNEDCMVMLTRTAHNNGGKWNDAQCSLQHGHICKTKVSPSATTVQEPPKCDDGKEHHKDFIKFNGNCYKWFSILQNWDQAEETCKSFDSNLVSILDLMEQSYVHTMLDNGGGWIGAVMTTIEDGYLWSDGSSFEYTNWGTTYIPEPSPGIKTCSFAMTSSGKWDREYCTGSRKPFLCKAPHEKVELHCLPEWSKSEDNHCYKVFNEGRMGFLDARQYCVSKAADLVSIGSSAEKEFLEMTLSFEMSDIAWTGLRKKDSSDDHSDTWKDYEWTDGTLTNEVLESAYLDSHQGADRCVYLEMNIFTMELQSLNCESQLTFVCEAPAMEHVPATDEPPAIHKPLPCNNSEVWFKHDEHSPYCYGKLNLNAHLDWHEAKELCEQDGARLPKLSSAKDNEELIAMVSGAVSGARVQPLWLGLNKDPKTDQFVWTDGSDAAYFSWDIDEPNNNGDMEGCVTFYAKQGHWNDDHCNRKHGIVCQIPSNGSWPTPISTKPPPGHCQQGHEEFLGHCYKIEKRHSLWSDARESCNGIGGGYDLASIHSMREQHFIFAMMVLMDVREDLWLGGISLGYDMFGWADGSAFSFTNWYQGSPGYGSSDERGVKIIGLDGNGMGKWTSGSVIGGTYGYICKGPVSTKFPNKHEPLMKACTLDGSQPDYDAYNGGCYKWVEVEQAWDEAEQWCRAENAHLVSILDEADQAFADANFFNDRVATSWTGLSNSMVDDLYIWSDGWRMEYSYWSRLPPSDKRYCVFIDSEDDGKWHAGNCSQKRPFLCKYAIDAPPTVGPNGHCLDGYEDLIPETNFCYKLNEDYQDWNEAEVECGISGGHLTSLHSKEEVDTIINSYESTVHAYAWIGLKSLNSNENSEYVWFDKTPLDFINWNDDEPLESTSGLCGKMEFATGKWEIAACFSSAKSICRSQKIQMQPPVTEPPHDTGTVSTAGMSAGGVAALVISLLIITGIMVGGVIYMKKKDINIKDMFSFKRLGGRRTVSSSAVGFSNVAYESRESALH